MKDQETKEQFIELRAKGWSYDRIAKELQTSKQTLFKVEQGIHLRNSQPSAIELQAFQKRYYLLKEKRFELFRDKVQTIKDELDRRDLKDIPAEKL